MQRGRKPARQLTNDRTLPPASRAAALTYWLAGLVAIVTFCTFLPALSNQFVNWDDRHAIIQNAAIRGLTLENIHWMFTHFHMGHYQPLALLTFAIDYELGGLMPFGYHLTNLLIHTSNAVIFYLVSIHLLRLAMPELTSMPRTLGVAAALAALFFSVHPLRVESVAWATERRDVLSAFFYLLAVFGYLIAHKRRVRGASSRGLMCIVVLMTVLSLLTKVIAVTLVGVLLVLDLYPLRRLRPATLFKRQARSVWLEKVPFLLLSVIMASIAPLAQAQSGAWAGLQPQGMLLRAAASLFSMSFYLWKTIWPVRLSPFYEMPETVSSIDIRFVIAGAAVLCAGPSVLAIRRRWGAFLSVWACYLILLAPVLGLFQVWPQIAADRYTYLACMGWAVLVAGAFLWLLLRGDAAWAFRLRIAGTPIALCIVGVLAARTWQQNKVWSDGVTLWRHVLAIEPRSFKGRDAMGEILLRLDRPREAEVNFREALRLRPNNPTHLSGLGLALLKLGREQEALEAFRNTIAIKEPSPEAHAGIGTILYWRGELPEAERELRRALELDSDAANTHAILADLLRRQGRFDEAVIEYNLAVGSDPGIWFFQHELAEALMMAGRRDEAFMVLRHAVMTDPVDPERLHALARALLDADPPGPPDEALSAARSASAMAGGKSAEYLDTLARAYAVNGNFSEAIAAAREACALAERGGMTDLSRRAREHLALFSDGRVAPAMPRTLPALMTRPQ